LPPALASTPLSEVSLLAIAFALVQYPVV